MSSRRSHRPAPLQAELAFVQADSEDHAPTRQQAEGAPAILLSPTGLLLQERPSQPGAWVSDEVKNSRHFRRGSFQRTARMGDEQPEKPVTANEFLMKLRHETSLQGSGKRASQSRVGTTVQGAVATGIQTEEETIRVDRVRLLQKVTQNFDLVGNSIYTTIAAEKEHIRNQRYTFKTFLHDVNDLYVVKKARLFFNKFGQAISDALLLNVDLVRRLGKPDPSKYHPRTLLLFPLEPSESSWRLRSLAYMIRRFCIFLVEWPLWTNIILVLVLSNALLLAIFDPLDDPSTMPSSSRRKTLENGIKAFSFLFALELTISFIAQGFYFAGNNSYLRSNWHKADFFIVALGILDFLPGLASGSFSALRSLRVLRPLRTITRFSHLQDLLVLIVRTMPLLKTILVMLFLLSVLYGAIGIQLWQGIMRRRCFHIESGERLGNVLPFYGFDRTCTLQGSVSPGLFACPADYSCLTQVNATPYLGFDNYVAALMTLFQILMLDGWGAICDQIIDAYSPLAIILIVVILITGPFMVLKLFLAVIAYKLWEIENEKRRRRVREVILSWTSQLQRNTFELWFENYKMQRLARNGSLGGLAWLRHRRELSSTFQGWRDFTFCFDGTQASKLAYLKRRNARRLRLKLAEDAFSLEMKLSLLMATHPRLGRDSPLYALHSDVGVWKTILQEVSGGLRSDLLQQLYDKDWEEHAWGETEIAALREIRSIVLVRWLLRSLESSAWFEGSIAFGTLFNGLLLVMQHQRDSTPGRLWGSDRDYYKFLVLLAGGFLVVSAIFLLEMLVRVLVHGPWYYLQSRWRLLDLLIVIVCLLLLPVDLQDFTCVNQLETYDQCSSGGSILRVFRSFRLLRLIRFLKILSTFPELALQLQSTVGVLKQVTGVLVLMALMLFVYVSMGLSFFGGKLYQPVKSYDLVLGSSVYVHLPQLQLGARGLPGQVEAIEPGRRRPYLVRVRTGFTDWATDFDNARPREWMSMASASGVGDATISSTVPRSNFNTFFFAFTSVLQVVFNRGWPSIFWNAVDQVGFYSCWYFYSLIFIGNWVLISVGFGIIITGKIGRERDPRNEEGDVRPNLIMRTLIRIRSKLLGGQQEAESGPDASPSQSNGSKEREQDEAATPFQLQLQLQLSSRRYLLVKAAAVLVSCACTLLERPSISDSERTTVTFLYGLTTLLFLFDFLLRVMGFNGRYVRRVSGLVEGVCLASALLDQLLSFLSSKGASPADGSSSLALVRVLRIWFLLDLLLLKRRGKLGLQSFELLLRSLLRSVSPILNTILLSVFVFTAFAILGMQVLGGKLHQCSDPAIFAKSNCTGSDELSRPRSWYTSSLTFDWFGSALESVWVISAANDWISFMWEGVDATSSETGPYQNHQLAIALYYFSVTASAALIVLNIFIGVFVSSYQTIHREVEKKRAPPTKPTRRELPDIFDTREIKGPMKILCRTIMDGSLVQSVMTLAISFTLLSMLLQSYHQSAFQERLVTISNAYFTLLFGAECFFRVFAAGGQRHYFSSYLNCFDYSVFLVGVIGLISESPALGGWIRSVRWLRAFRTLRILKVLGAHKIVRSIGSIRDVLFALHKAVPIALHLILLLCCVFYMYGVIGVKMFSNMCVDGDQFLPGLRATRCLLVQDQDPSLALSSKLLGPHTHFRHVGWALLSLLKVATVDGVSPLLKKLDLSRGPRLPDEETAMSRAISALRMRNNATRSALRRTFLLEARAHVPGCLTSQELDRLQEAGVLDCRLMEEESATSCRSTCGNFWLSQVYFMSFAMITSFVLLNVLVSVFIIELRRSHDRSKPKMITRTLDMEKFHRICKRWRWNAVLRVAYGHWLILNDFSLHSDSAGITDDSRSTSTSDLSSLSSCGGILPRDEELEEEEAGEESESERSTEAAHKFLFTKGKRLTRQLDEEQEMNVIGGGQRAPSARASMQSRRRSSQVAGGPARRNLQALRESLTAAEKAAEKVGGLKAPKRAERKSRRRRVDGHVE